MKMRRAACAVLIAWLGALAPLLAQVHPPGFPLGARIPAITGQVVDALTGKPVVNIDVTLRASEVGGERLRRESVLTSPNGTFAFKTSLEPKLTELLAQMEQYWLTVNHTFTVSDKTKRLTPSEQAEMDFTPDDLSWEIMSDPLFKPEANQFSKYGLMGHAVSSPSYFPMAVQFVHPCKQTWNANCVLFSQTENIRMALIPVLDDPQQCNAIAEAAIKEQCRQLNTYRAAFLHIETVAEVRRDKELCRDVDQGPATKHCLETLLAYVDRSISASHRPPPVEADPIDQVLILTPIAGLTVHRGDISPLHPFLETLRYVAWYRLKNSQEDTAAVWVSMCGTEEGRQREMGLGSGQSTIETVDGNKILTVDSAPQYTALWTSGSRVIRIDFFHAANSGAPRITEASPEARREIIRQYLAKYPSSL